MIEISEKLEKQRKKRLLAVFKEVNKNFKDVYRLLSDGGRGELRLEHPTDPFKGGLEMWCQPKGKSSRSRLNGLSGGEKSMTASALILAVFLQNPSPICVLDEVDAPLDDINVEKFCNVIKKINEDTLTKFIVITHNPISMSHMSRLYGVTMSEKGVSQLISIKLDEAQKLREVG